MRILFLAFLLGAGVASAQTTFAIPNLGTFAIPNLGPVPEVLMNAYRICNAHAVAYEAGHPDKHNQWHGGYEACSKIEPYVRKILAPAERRAHWEQAARDRAALQSALKMLPAATPAK
jgi:hypothetical protein